MADETHLVWRSNRYRCTGQNKTRAHTFSGLPNHSEFLLYCLKDQITSSLQETNRGGKILCKHVVDGESLSRRVFADTGHYPGMDRTMIPHLVVSSHTVAQYCTNCHNDWFGLNTALEAKGVEDSTRDIRTGLDTAELSFNCILPVSWLMTRVCFHSAQPSWEIVHWKGEPGRSFNLIFMDE